MRSLHDCKGIIKSLSPANWICRKIETMKDSQENLPAARFYDLPLVQGSGLLSLECAPMGKSARSVHQFMVKRHLPPLFGLWAILSVLIALFIAAFVLRPVFDHAYETGSGYIGAILLLPALLALFKILAKPTHLEADPHGVRNSWRRSITFKGKPLKWNEMENISIIQPANTSRIQSRVLVFQGHKRSISLQIDEVTEASTLPVLYQTIMLFAPQVPRDPQLQALLGADAAHGSYTELWLKALTAPPDRARLAPLAPGTMLQSGEYEIIDRIGAGGQGVAYSARSRNHSDHAMVVLKEYVLPVGVSHATKVDSLEKFQREAQILGKIDHPQIVRLLDFFFEDHRGYMAMEFVEGETLSDLRGKREFLEREILALAAQMATILQYLHEREPPIIHRDFTPDNLILTKQGILKLIDFNVAQQQTNTVTSTVVGKHAYISPDQFRGQIGPQSDIYSMGATLAFLFTGVQPKPISVSHPRDTNPAITAGADNFVATCTAVIPEKRYQNAAEMLKALGELQKEEIT